MDDVAREVLCRVFDADVIPEFHAWYKPEQWLWWGRGLGAFIRQRLDAAPEARLTDAMVERGARALRQQEADDADEDVRPWEEIGDDQLGWLTISRRVLTAALAATPPQQENDK